MENQDHSHAGKEIKKIAYQYGGVVLMNEDNKHMLEKVKEKQTSKEVVETLLTDPQSGRTMSYAESRMRFG